MSVPRFSEKRSPWYLRLHTLCVYLFLYAPIIVLVLFSFNTDRRNTTWQGFTLDWYFSLFQNETILRALGNSLKVGLCATFFCYIDWIVGRFGLISLRI